MKQEQFKKFYTRLRMIRNSKMVGTHGHYSDLVKEFKVSMCFIQYLNYMSKAPKMLIYGKYTKEYQDEAEQSAAWESYGEKRIGA